MGLIAFGLLLRLAIFRHFFVMDDHAFFHILFYFFYFGIAMHKDPVNQHSWLKSALSTIEDRISDQAYALRQEGPPILSSDIARKYQPHYNKLVEPQIDPFGLAHGRSIDQIKADQETYRGKLKQLQAEMQQKTQRKQFENISLKYKVKSNSELKMLTRKYRQFERSLEEKNRLIMQQEEQQKIETSKLRKERMTSVSIQRRKKIEEALKNIEYRREKRAEMLEEQKKYLKKMKKKKLFEKMLEQFTKESTEKNDEKVQQLRKLKKDISVDFSTISAHEKEYQRQKQQKQEKRTIKMAESRVLPELPFYKSKFLTSVLEQEKRNKQLQLEKITMGKKMRERQKQYEDRVHEEFAPQVDQSLNSSYENEEDHKRSALQREKLKEIGNNFYKQGQKKIVSPQRHYQLQKQRQKLMSLTRDPYPNYLKQTKNQTQNLIPRSLLPQSPDTTSQSHTVTLPTARSSVQRSYLKKVDEIKSIINEEKLKKLDKLQEIRSMMEGLEYSFTPNDKVSEDDMIMRLNAKLDIIKMLDQKQLRG